MGFSASDDNTPVGTYAVEGTTKLGTTTFGAITELKAGNGSYFVTFGGTNNRWGDYSATVIDPLNPNSFWTFQEFVNGANNWGVQITQIFVPEPAAVLTSLIGLATCLAFVRRRRRALK
jgi:hypothetical protein